MNIVECVYQLGVSASAKAAHNLTTYKLHVLLARGHSQCILLASICRVCIIPAKVSFSSSILLCFSFIVAYAFNVIIMLSGYRIKKNSDM